MEMSKGVSLLRAAQSLLTGRTIHGSWFGVLHEWMNGYSTLLHNIAPGKCIVIKVEYGLQLRLKYFLRNQIEKKKIIKMLMVLDFKIFSL